MVKQGEVETCDIAFVVARPHGVDDFLGRQQVGARHAALARAASLCLVDFLLELWTRVQKDLPRDTSAVVHPFVRCVQDRVDAQVPDLTLEYVHARIDGGINGKCQLVAVRTRRGVLLLALPGAH